MSTFITYLIPGIPVGCVYALMAVGLVLTYKTSGVFNLAFGAQAYVSALVFYLSVESLGWPIWAGALVAILLVGPLVGVALDRMLFRHIRAAPSIVKLVVALALLIGIPTTMKLLFGNATRLNPPSIVANASQVYHFGAYYVSKGEIVTVAVTVVVVALLGALFRYSELGLHMRAVVESPRMLELAGVNADRVGTFAWGLSSFLAGLAGVLLAPLFSRVSSLDFTTLLVSAIAAAALGSLTSLPLTLLGGLLLGIGQAVLTGYLPLNSVLATGLRPAFPFVVLVLLLLALPGLRGSMEVIDPLSGCDPPPPPLAASVRDPRLDRVARIGFPVFVAAFVLSAMTWVPSFWVFILTQGIAFSIIFLSITVLTGMGGQISLCQASFAGFGAFAAGQLAMHLGLSVILGALVGAVAAAVLGALVALPALRLGGIALALATLAFALLADNVLFPLGWLGNGTTGVSVPRPVIGSISFAGTRAFFLLALVVLAACSAVVIMMRRGMTGRYLAAIRGSELAASTVGINVARAKVMVFALSAGLAGIGGVVYASTQGSVSPTDFNYFFSLVFVVLVVTTGVKTVEGAINAGMAYVILQQLLSYIPNHPAWLHRFSGIEILLFALGALGYVIHPEGMVEFQKRFWTERIARMLDRRGGHQPSEGSGLGGHGEALLEGKAPDGWRPSEGGGLGLRGGAAGLDGTQG
ncbi:MAG: ABC transporter permease [Actinomycetota bacterium]|jgi:branched-subunit amino acid ABC-type transport system permease component|nr:ABC transporter permease [Actinomycetota bacterium]